MSDIDKILSFLKINLIKILNLEQNNIILDDYESNILNDNQDKDLVYFINIFTQNFYKFKNKFKNPSILNILFNIKTFRNIWAHQGKLNIRELYKFYDDSSYLLEELCPYSEEFKYVEFQRRLAIKEMSADFNDFIVNHSDNIVNWKLHMLNEELYKKEKQIEILKDDIIILQRENSIVKQENNKKHDNKNSYNNFAINKLQPQNNIIKAVIDEDVNMTTKDYNVLAKQKGYELEEI
jgi:hypothetical protein